MDTDLDRGVVLVAAAVPQEIAAVCDGLGVATPQAELWEVAHLGAGSTGGWAVLVTGVGKANAAGAVAAALAREPGRFSCVVSTGIAGALPVGMGALAIGGAAVASACVLADEGVRTPQGFLTCESIGFPAGLRGDAVMPDPAWSGWALPAADAHAPIATVSNCSGADWLALEVCARTGAIAEAMEGAGAGLAAARFGVPFVEVRTISNLTGDRERHPWDIGAGLARVRAVFGRLRGAVRPG